MGTIYTVEDYATRILVYLHENPKATTTEIIRDVTGTNERLMEGLVWALSEKKVKARIRKYEVRWHLKE